MEEKDHQEQQPKQNGDWHKTQTLQGMYENWFLDYASYVILERAVPNMFDGLKPVQRRILHAMKELDDGRYNKVANLIGHTMKYHPHGDAAIGDALVQLGQKDLLIDTQGNWGNNQTGDSAAAPRYIEARLSAFALDVVFNPKITEWTLSYDGRNQEPLTLPVKFPLLLAQGVEGIAVGLSSKVLPHNFNELIDASIQYLKGKTVALYPDFQSGGLIDVSRYNDGKKGSRVKVRAKISKVDKKTLAITELPFSQTTNSLIESIVAANDKGKIKIKKIDDNTAANVEILLHLPGNTSVDQTIDALYAFTNCEVSISPNAVVIEEDKPRFVGVSEILATNTLRTRNILFKEQEIRKSELLEKILFSSLEKIFIEKRIYRKIETCETWKEILETIDRGLKPYKKDFYREVTTDDLTKLTQIPIKRISKFDSMKADEILIKLEEELKQVQYNMDHIVEFTIDYFKTIRKKYGKGKERKTEIRDFENIEAVVAAVANERLYIDREAGFAGTSLKKAAFVTECSDIDDMIVFRRNGTFEVKKVGQKVFIGEDVIHLSIFKKNDDRTIYNMVYRDGLNGRYYAKRFPVKGITRDREYDLTRGNNGSKIIYFSANPNGEAEVISVNLYPRPRLKKTTFTFDFSELPIRNRSAQGNILTRYAIRKIRKKEDGVSTFDGIDIWLDENVMRLNTDAYGRLLGKFKEDDKILAFFGDNKFCFHSYDLTTHFEEDTTRVEKFDDQKIFTAVYYHGERKAYFVKRFIPEYSEKEQEWLDGHKKTKLVYLTDEKCPVVELVFDNTNRRKPRENETINLWEFIDVKGYKAIGNKLSQYEIKEVKVLDPISCEEAENEEDSLVQENEATLPEEQSREPEDDQMELGF
jgi:topoisomerase-4 subunit A